jgi:thiamine pyrophosphokinase
MVTEMDRYLPDLIIGDLDSLRSDVRAFYESHGVPVVQQEDQDSTDLMKCIRALEEKERRDNSGVRSHPRLRPSQRSLTMKVDNSNTISCSWED